MLSIRLTNKNGSYKVFAGEVISFSWSTKNADDEQLQSDIPDVSAEAKLSVKDIFFNTIVRGDEAVVYDSVYGYVGMYLRVIDVSIYARRGEVYISFEGVLFSQAGTRIFVSAVDAQSWSDIVLNFGVPVEFHGTPVSFVANWFSPKDIAVAALWSLPDKHSVSVTPFVSASPTTKFASKGAGIFKPYSDRASFDSDSVLYRVLPSQLIDYSEQPPQPAKTHVSSRHQGPQTFNPNVADVSASVGWLNQIPRTFSIPELGISAAYFTNSEGEYVLCWNDGVVSKISSQYSTYEAVGIFKDAYVLLSSYDNGSTYVILSKSDNHVVDTLTTTDFQPVSPLNGVTLYDSGVSCMFLPVWQSSKNVAIIEETDGTYFFAPKPATNFGMGLVYARSVNGIFTALYVGQTTGQKEYWLYSCYYASGWVSMYRRYVVRGTTLGDIAATVYNAYPIDYVFDPDLPSTLWLLMQTYSGTNYDSVLVVKIDAGNFDWITGYVRAKLEGRQAYRFLTPVEGSVAAYLDTKVLVFTQPFGNPTGEDVWELLQDSADTDPGATPLSELPIVLSGSVSSWYSVAGSLNAKVFLQPYGITLVVSVIEGGALSVSFQQDTNPFVSVGLGQEGFRVKVADGPDNTVNVWQKVGSISPAYTKLRKQLGRISIRVLSFDVKSGAARDAWQTHFAKNLRPMATGAYCLVYLSKQDEVNDTPVIVYVTGSSFNYSGFVEYTVTGIVVDQKYAVIGAAVVGESVVG